MLQNQIVSQNEQTTTLTSFTCSEKVVAFVGLRWRIENSTHN